MRVRKRPRSEFVRLIGQIRELAALDLTRQEIADRLGEPYAVINSIAYNHHIAIKASPNARLVGRRKPAEPITSTAAPAAAQPDPSEMGGEALRHHYAGLKRQLSRWG
jgi:hypothetical protein